MSIEVPLNSVTSPLNLKSQGIVEYDILTQPDVGGRQELTSSFNGTFNGTIIIARSSDRISPSTEPQEPENFTAIDSEKLMQDVRRLRLFYYSGLGMQDEINIFRNYDPPLFRAMWEQLKTPEEKRKCLEQETANVIKSLGERYCIVESGARYTIDALGKLRSEAFDNEPFEEVIRRGAEYAENWHSPDAEREEAQLQGILKVQSAMAASVTLKNAKVIVVSDRGREEGTTFTYNFVDIFEFVGEDPITKRRQIEMTRFTSSASNEQYLANIKEYRADYFNNFDQTTGSIANFMAANGIEIDPRVDSRNATEIFLQLAGTAKDVLSKENFQRIIEDSKTRVNYYLEALCATVFNPQEVALRWNAIVAGADRVWGRLKDIPHKVFERATNFFRDPPVFKNIVEEVAWLGRQVIEKIMAGCGLSGGFSVVGRSIKSFISGIKSSIRAVGRFISSLFKSEWHCENCPVCGEYINCEVKPGEKCPNPECNAIRQCG